ncbi:hypothetical protein NLM33_16290 [Bradyrhizobium sp. CCGUVB1N3]|uniref:hypothetical protein n=1 Tax=Bradyrhizobium sp. CCGUVB1N3 TaxID=2949629 RepID=UPI0020B2A4CC|nr:hypothetical protein [Bradyrhizobium sp. CCGUVB1N3]MCP3471876.1 hypothetical protein [Bradyrhizobium sp. CCGUVB1N3]
MVLKSVSFSLATALLLACSSAAMADDYKPDEYLGLDLSKAVLSPKRLGPATQFAPVEVEARSDAARAVPDVTPKTVATERVKAPEPRVAHAKSTQLRGAARTKLAHRHTSPLDALAMDTRIQTWPCRSGGICNWRR